METPSRWSSLAIAHPVVLAPMGGVGTPAFGGSGQQGGRGPAPHGVPGLPGIGGGASAAVATLVEELVAALRE